MYGVLYAISPEVFPAKDRGTGNGLVATATRVFGVLVSPTPFHLTVESCSLTSLAWAGTRHRTVCEPQYGRAGVRFGRDHHQQRIRRVAPALRAPREDVHLTLASCEGKRMYVCVCEKPLRCQKTSHVDVEWGPHFLIRCMIEMLFLLCVHCAP